MMKLGPWLEAHPDIAAGFHTKIRVSRFSLHRYVTGDRIPKPVPMRRIFVETGGQVEPNDFYDLPKIDGDGARAAPASQRRQRKKPNRDSARVPA